MSFDYNLMRDHDLVRLFVDNPNRTRIRQRLRSLAGERMAWVLSNSGELPPPSKWARKIARDSEFSEENGGSLRLKATFGAIRDRLNLNTLMYLCRAIEIRKPDPDDLAIKAVSSVTGACVKATVKATSSRSAFGQPGAVTEKYFSDHQEKIMTGISTFLDAYDYVIMTRSRDPEAFMGAVSDLGFDQDMVEAVIANRGSEPRHVYDLSADAADLANKILVQMDEDEDADAGADSDDASPAAATRTPYKVPEGDLAGLINMTLRQAGLPEIDSLVGEINGLMEDVSEKEAELEQAKRLAGSAKTAAAVVENEPATGELPYGEPRMTPACEAMGLERGHEVFGFDVPVWHWEHEHPHVPEVDPTYVFKPDELLRVLYAIVAGEKAYLHGHTGTGKTSLIEQVAARLNWPVMRVNFDSEITRMDLIGRDVLANEDGATTSTFVDGVLPRMLQGPYIGIFDEIDFVRPDVAYVMQRALEGNGLVITEDGGRVVKPHPMCRLFATGNTVGQGDEFGLYQGARPQSMAMLDRFGVWVSVDYMSRDQRLDMLGAQVPSLGKDDLQLVNHYVSEHLEAFTNAQVMQPISPRGYVAFARAMSMFLGLFPSSRRKHAIQQALETTILDRASQQDRAVLKAVGERVFG